MDLLSIILISPVVIASLVVMIPMWRKFRDIPFYLAVGAVFAINIGWIGGVVNYPEKMLFAISAVAAGAAVLFLTFVVERRQWRKLEQHELDREEIVKLFSEKVPAPGYLESTRPLSKKELRGVNTERIASIIAAPILAGLCLWGAYYFYTEEELLVALGFVGGSIVLSIILIRSAFSDKTKLEKNTMNLLTGVVTDKEYTELTEEEIYEVKVSENFDIRVSPGQYKRIQLGDILKVATIAGNLRPSSVQIIGNINSNFNSLSDFDSLEDSYDSN